MSPIGHVQSVMPVLTSSHCPVSGLNSWESSSHSGNSVVDVVMDNVVEVDGGWVDGTTVVPTSLVVVVVAGGTVVDVGNTVVGVTIVVNVVAGGVTVVVEVVVALNEVVVWVVVVASLVQTLIKSTSLPSRTTHTSTNTTLSGTGKRLVVLAASWIGSHVLSLPSNRRWALPTS